MTNMLDFTLTASNTIEYDGMTIGYVIPPGTGFFLRGYIGVDLAGHQYYEYDSANEAARRVVTEYRKPLTTVLIRDGVKMIDDAYSHDEDLERISDWEKRMLARVLIGIAAGAPDAKELAREVLRMQLLAEKYRRASAAARAEHTDDDDEDMSKVPKTSDTPPF